MRRFFLKEGALQGKRMIFEGEEARHISRVLRLKRGERITGFDGRGREYIGTIAIIAPRHVEAVITEKKVAPKKLSLRVGLSPAVIKGAGLDDLLRRAVEIGISDFYPLLTSRTVVQPGKKREKREQRWKKIVRDAVRQSGRSRIPVVHPFRDWKGVLCLVSEFDLCLLPWEKEKKNGIKDLLSSSASSPLPASILVVIGPEGGFTDREVEAAVRAGFKTVSLGPATLRSATAALAALTCVHYQFGW